MTDLMVPSKRPRAPSFWEKHPEYSESHASAAWLTPDEKEMAPPPVQVNSFLEICRFCKKNLRHDEDVFMYGYLGAFCSKECRTKQMACDIFKDFPRDKAKAKKGRTCVTKPKESKDIDGLERIAASSRFYI